MALEKDQERPTSPGGSRRIKVRNMNYILDMPVNGHISAGTYSSNKRDQLGSKVLS